ncbi:histidine kinase [Halobaculum marinum]|uniref:Histidine kinase n=1 Tax=Halobaculum marinum TaxID=3031996 RepID=A0ABD5WZJ1_9EURY|nr:histidine kinase [Halobaculum sp. DT55]
MNVPSAGDQLALKPGGIVIAVVAFASTRLLLAGVVFSGMGTAPLATTAQLVPLAGGLATALYGVNLAVSTHSREYARTVAVWFLLGIVVTPLLTALPAVAEAGGAVTLRAGSVVAGSVVAGGAVGVVVGVQSATAEGRRQVLARQAEQSVLLNRLLRHEVLNSLTVIRGHAELLAERGDDDGRSRAAVDDAVERIEHTLDEVRVLLRSDEDTVSGLVPVRVDRALEAASTTATADTHDVDLPTVSVRADENLVTLLSELLAMPARAGGAASVEVTATERVVEVAVAAPGAWLSDRDRGVLVDGVPEYEHNDVDYGIPLVRLLVAQYGGTLAVDDDGDTTTVRVGLPRTGRNVPPSNDPGVAGARLWAALGVGLVAGVLMGGVLHAATGSLAVIGALYGAESSAAGWVAHLFHSGVFATVFVAVTAVGRPATVASSVRGSVLLGAGYGVLLWLIGSGVVLGLWLRTVGIAAAVPNLDPVSLGGHLVWGITVGALASLLTTADVELAATRFTRWLSAAVGRP